MDAEHDIRLRFPHIEKDIERTLEIIGGKRSLVITTYLCKRDMRFGELRAAMDINPKTLTLRLKELEQNGIIRRTQYPTIPPKVEYSLTEKGRDLWRIADAMGAWAEKWL